MRLLLLMRIDLSDHTILVVVFTIVSSGMIYFAFRTAKADPGVLRSNQSTRVNVSSDLIDDYNCRLI